MLRELYMKTKRTNKKEQFGWACGYERIYGGYHADNERCICSSKNTFESVQDAARAAIKHRHTNSTYIYSNKKGYVGLAVGLHFNSAHK